MQKVNDDYRPEIIEFTANSKIVPNSLGKFKNADEARKFISENLLGINTKVSTTRKIDFVEIEFLREQYSNELETDLPALKQKYDEKHSELETAKKNEKDAKEMVSASLNKIQQLANEVNDGTTEINLDPEFTWEIAYNGKRFYYTFMDNEIKLAKVTDIASYEADDLISTSERNARYFEKLKAVNE